jgi:hypothetical protein
MFLCCSGWRLLGFLIALYAKAPQLPADLGFVHYNMTRGYTGKVLGPGTTSEEVILVLCSRGLETDKHCKSSAHVSALLRSTLLRISNAARLLAV